MPMIATPEQATRGARPQQAPSQIAGCSIANRSRACPEQAPSDREVRVEWANRFTSSARSDSHSARSASPSAISDSHSALSLSNSARSESNPVEFQLAPLQSSAPHPAESDSSSARSESNSAESQLTHSRSHRLLSNSIAPLTHRKNNRGAQGREGGEGGASQFSRSHKTGCRPKEAERDWWRRRESNPRPKSLSAERLHAQSVRKFRSRRSERTRNAEN